MSVEIHHLAAISSDLQRTIAFYHNVLGLKFIRKASLFDGPKVCHFYWSKGVENFITFYHCPGLYEKERDPDANGAISFSINIEAKIFWTNRLKYNNVRFRATRDELENRELFILRDPDGLQIRLVFTSDKEDDAKDDYSFNSYAIKCIYGIEIVSGKVFSLRSLFINQFKMEVLQRSENRYRFRSTKQGSIIDLSSGPACNMEAGGRGRIHHIALKIQSWKQYLHLQKYFGQQNQSTIFKKHPNNYSALYFRNDGDLLFEIVAQQPSMCKRAFLDLKGNIPDVSKKNHL
jgi:glyoxalase family protein